MSQACRIKTGSPDAYSQVASFTFTADGRQKTG